MKLQMAIFSIYHKFYNVNCKLYSQILQFNLDWFPIDNNKHSKTGTFHNKYSCVQGTNAIIKAKTVPFYYTVDNLLASNVMDACTVCR